MINVTLSQKEIIMATVRFDPFRGFEKLSCKMNELMGELEKGVTFETGGFAPRVDIIEDEKAVYVHAEMPGLVRSDIKVSVNEDRLLTIKGEKKSPEIEAGKTQIRSERSFGSFSRSFVLPENLDVENINAKFDNGVLELTMSKVEPPKPKEIHIDIA